MKILVTRGNLHLANRATHVVAVVCISLASAAVSADLALELSGANRAGTCSPDGFSTRTSPEVLMCCQDGHRTWSTRDGTSLAFRVHATACTEDDGVSTNCGIGSVPFKQCTYGPCGARIEWAVEAAEVRIFMPRSKLDKCGWEVSDIGECLTGDTCDWYKKGVRHFPEPYSDQPLYPGVIAGCQFNRCFVGGIPSP
jgi:hypothetical protein